MNGLRALLLGTTFLTFSADQAQADPVSLAFVMTAAGGAASAALAGTAIVWSTVLAQAAFAAVGVMVSQSQMRVPGPTSRDITLNSVQPITEGLILYGERMLGGSVTARSVTSAGGETNGRYHSIIPLACHEIDGAVEVWLGEQKVWTAEQYALDEGGSGNEWTWGQIASDYKGKFKLRVYTGADDQVADARYVAAAAEWAATAQGKGVSYIYFEADFDPDIYPRGPDKIRVRARGKRVYDPRDGGTRYTTNPALHLRDYALTSEARGGIGWAVSDVDDAAIVALANVSDEAVALAEGGSEARYAFNGVLSTADSPEVNLDRLATAWGGWWVVDRGQLTPGGGAYQAPSFEIDVDVISGPVKVMARRPFEQQFNRVKAVYADPLVEFTATDLPVLSSTLYQAEDNGEELVRDLGEFPGETSFTRGQRLQRRALLRGRRQKRAEIPCNLAAWGVKIGDTVRVTLERRGWDQKEFEVERRVVHIGPGKVEVRLSLIETSAAVDDWSTSLELPRPAGGASTLPSPFAKPVLTAPSTTESLYETRGGGGVKLRVALTSSSDDPFIDEWQFAWGLAADAVGDYTVGPKQAGPALVIDDLKPGTYVFGVRARNLRGLWSDWLYGAPEVIEGRNEAPAALTGFSVQALGALALAKWDRHPSVDVQQGGEIEFRHSVDLGASWTTSTTVARSVQGLMTEAPLPLKAGLYLARAKDSQGITSGVASFEVSRTGLDGLSLLFENEAAPSFAGAKSGVTLFGAEVRLDDGVSAGSVAFAERVDLGSVQDVRAVSDVRARVASPANAFGQSGGLFGAAGVLFGESGGAEGDVQMWVRSTLVDPDLAGPSDWSPWQRLDAADFTARGFEVEGRLLADADDFVVAVTGLKISIYG